MTTSIQQNLPSSFPTVYCNKLVVTPVTTNLKWSARYKHQDVRLIGRQDIAKVVNTGGTRGIIGNTDYVIGTAVASWIYTSFINDSMHVGMASLVQDLSTLEGVALNREIDMLEGDRLEFTLTAASILSIKHTRGESRPIFTYINDLAEFTGQTLRYWVSSAEGKLMGMKIFANYSFTTTVLPSGEVKMVTSTSEIVDFSMQDIIDNDPDANDVLNEEVDGGGGGGGDTLDNPATTSEVKVDDDGDIILDGGISFSYENFDTPIATVNITNDTHVVLISNAATTTVNLTSAVGTHAQHYTIIRRYPLQGGETVFAPFLNVFGTGGDTIEGDASVGVPPDASIQLVSDGLGTWYIL